MSDRSDGAGGRVVGAGARVRVAPDVVRREFPAQTVVLNLRTGRYHGLNPIAARMLSVLEQGASVGVAAGVIARRYGQPRGEVERDIRGLCDRLLERGLVELDDEPGPTFRSAPER